MKFKKIYIWLVIVTLASCGKQSWQSLMGEEETESQVHSSLMASDQIYVALEKEGGAYTLYLSSSLDTETLGLCAMSKDESESCTTKHSSYQELVRERTDDQRHIHRLEEKFSPDADKIYHVIDADSQYLQLKFRLSPSTSSDPTTDPINEPKFDESTLRQELTYYAGDEFRGRLAGTSENEKAAQYIIEQLKKIQMQPAQSGTYLQSFSITTGPLSGKQSANIVAVLPGQDPKLKDEVIVIGAHMDHTGTLELGYTCDQGSRSESICAGADDNGSGTISVLNIAKAFTKVQKDLKRTVAFIWFSAEEEGLIGSTYYVQQDPIFSLDKTIYMMNLDMVGYLKQNANVIEAIGGGSSRSAETMIKKAVEKYSGYTLQVNPDYESGASDHLPFMNKGIPGVAFHTGVKSNPNYHTTGDTPDKIDYSGMMLITQLAYEVLYEMATDEGFKPSGTNASKREPFISDEAFEVARYNHMGHGHGPKE